MTGKIVVVLSGPPGTGKSTIAAELAKNLQDAIVVEVDDVKKRNHGTTTKSSREDFAEAGRLAATVLDEHTYALIVEAFFVEELLDLVLQQLPRDAKIEKFLFWCEVETAVKRATSRQVDRLREMDVRQVFACFQGTYPDRRRIYTEITGPHDAAAEISTLLQSAQ